MGADLKGLLPTADRLRPLGPEFELIIPMFIDNFLNMRIVLIRFI